MVLSSAISRNWWLNQYCRNTGSSNPHVPSNSQKNLPAALLKSSSLFFHVVPVPCFQGAHSWELEILLRGLGEPLTLPPFTYQKRIGQGPRFRIVCPELSRLKKGLWLHLEAITACSVLTGSPPPLREPQRIQMDSLACPGWISWGGQIDHTSIWP